MPATSAEVTPTYQPTTAEEPPAEQGTPSVNLDDLPPEEQEKIANAIGGTGWRLYEDLEDVENYLKYGGGLYLAAAFGAAITGLHLPLLDLIMAICMVAASYQADSAEGENYARDSSRKWALTLTILFIGAICGIIGIGFLSFMIVFQIPLLLITLYAIKKIYPIYKHVSARYKADPNAYSSDATWKHELSESLAAKFK